MRTYDTNQNQPDYELEKFVINSVLSATHTSQMDKDDQNDIINKIKEAGENDSNNNENNSSNGGDNSGNSGNDNNGGGSDLGGVENNDNQGGEINETDENIFLDKPKKNNMFQPNSNDILNELKPCWNGYEQIGTKDKDGKEVPNCVPIKENKNYEDEYGITECSVFNEGKYDNKPLNKPMKGDIKKFKVYVKNEKGNVVKINFGDPNMEIKRDDPERRKAFRARHNCSEAKDKTTPKYWSCKMWSTKPVSQIVGEGEKLINRTYLLNKLNETFNTQPISPDLVTEPIVEETPIKISLKNKPFLPTNKPIK